MPEPQTFPEPFEALLAEGRLHFEADRLEESLELFRRAETVAEEMGDPRAADRAFVNVSAVEITIERARGLSTATLKRLREILMGGEDDVNCRLAAYNIARAYEYQKEFRKGRFYAQIALDRSRLLDHGDWLASSHNQLANFLLAESRFEDACREYHQALDRLADDGEDATRRRRALIQDNLGYALFLLGRQDEGLDLLYRSLRTLRHLGARRDQISPRLDLSFALLELGRHRDALHHAAHALGLAEEMGEDDSVKNALYLLGEAAHQSGEPLEARHHFQTLQERYFPDSGQLADMLLTVDVRKLVNLKA